MARNEGNTCSIEGLGILFDGAPNVSKNLQSLADIIPSAIVLVSANGKLMYVNKRGVELFGYDFPGFDLREVTFLVKALKPDRKPFPLEEIPIRRSIKSGQVIRNVKMLMDNALGIRYLVNEGFFLAEMIYDELGKPIDYLHLAANTALDLVIGLKREEIIGKTRQEVVPTPSPWIETFGKVALTAQPIMFEDFSVLLNRRFLIRSFSPKQDQFACLIQDVMEQRRLEEELVNQQYKTLQSEKEKAEVLRKAMTIKDEFLIMITHEFKIYK